MCEIHPQIKAEFVLNTPDAEFAPFDRAIVVNIGELPARAEEEEDHLAFDTECERAFHWGMLRATRC